MSSPRVGRAAGPAGRQSRRLAALLVALMVPAFVGLHGEDQAPAAGVSPTGSLGGLEAKFIDVKCVRTRYYEAGQGEPIVLVHGEGFSGHSSANTWVKNIPGLAKRFHVFALDKMASGMTGNPLDDKDMNIQGEVEHVYQFIQVKKLGKVHLVGQSRAGGCVFFLGRPPRGRPDPRHRRFGHGRTGGGPDRSAGRARELPEAAGLRGVAVPAARHLLPAGRCLRRAVLQDGLLHGEPAEGGGDRCQGQGRRRRAAALAIQRVEEAGVRARQEGGHPPDAVLLYWGKNDPSAMLKDGLAPFDIISATNLSARMLIANNAGHFHYWEYPEEWNQNVINFIDYWNRQPAAQEVARSLS